MKEFLGFIGIVSIFTLLVGAIAGVNRGIDTEKCFKHNFDYFMSPTLYPTCKFADWASEKIN